LLKERFIFPQYMPKKHKLFGIKICKPRDETGYTYDLTVYSLLDGGEEISYTDSLLILVNDKLETMVHVGRQE